MKWMRQKKTQTLDDRFSLYIFSRAFQSEEKPQISLELIELNMEISWLYLPNVNCLVECVQYLSDLEPNANSGCLAYDFGPCNFEQIEGGKKERNEIKINEMKC